MNLPPFEEAFRTVCELAADFKRNESRYLDPHYQEAEARKDFIDKFFIALGWDVNHDSQRNPYAQEVKVERKPDSSTQRRADYAFFIAPNFRDVRFFAEAKKPQKNLYNADFYFQLIRYAWNAGTPVGVLTDFEEFHVIDCRFRPAVDTALERCIEQFHYTDYTDSEKFARIFWLFSRVAVAENALENFAEGLKKPAGRGAQQKLFPGLQTIDESFLTELDDVRKRLAAAFKKKNPSWEGELLTEATQRTIDRLVFMRFLEDKLIEPDFNLGALGARRDLWTDFLQHCRKFNAKYNGVVFKEHFIDSDACAGPDADAFAAVRDELSRESSPYDFNGIPVHILGSIYERFLGKVIVATEKRVRVEEKPEVRKAGGVFYTPQYIVRYIVNRTAGELIADRTPSQILKMRFADIACGSGSFLITLFEALLDRTSVWYQEHPEEAEKAGCVFADGRWNLTLKQKQAVLTSCIHGVDIDMQAVEVTQLSLYLKLLEDETTATANEMQVLFKEKILPDLSRNIVCGNSLVEPDILSGKLFAAEEEREINPLDFRMAFPQAMREGGFDAIVGNPPYVRQEGLGAVKTYFKTRYKVYDGTADLYSYFIERGVSLLKKDGLFGYIVANKWMRANYGRALRAWLKQQCIAELTDFGDLPVFKGVTTYPCILRIRKSSPGESFQAAVADTLEFDSLEGYVSGRSFLIRRDSLQDSGWTLTDERTQKLLAKLKAAGVQLGEYIGGKIYRGILTGLNEAFVIDAETRARLIAEDPRSEELIKPFLAGRDIKRYAPLKSDKWLILIPNGWTSRNAKGPKWKWFESAYPAIAGHLLPFKEKAEKRYDQGEYWWELRACDYYEVFEKPKILFPDISQRGNFTLDYKGVFYSVNTTYFICSNEKYLLALLNSSLMDFINKRMFATYQGGYLRFFYQYLVQLPILRIDRTDKEQTTIHQMVENYVDDMIEAQRQLANSRTDKDLTFYRNKCVSLDRQIDELVHRLYDLTEEEISLIGAE